jgi:hypothetical protein
MKMKRFRFSAHVTVSAHTEVIAETEEDAREIASGREVQLNGYAFDEEAFIIEDADGEPMKITLVHSEETDEEAHEE